MYGPRPWVVAVVLCVTLHSAACYPRTAEDLHRHLYRRAEASTTTATSSTSQPPPQPSPPRADNSTGVQLPWNHTVTAVAGPGVRIGAVMVSPTPSSDQPKSECFALIQGGLAKRRVTNDATPLDLSNANITGETWGFAFANSSWSLLQPDSWAPLMLFRSYHTAQVSILPDIAVGLHDPPLSITGHPQFLNATSPCLKNDTSNGEHCPFPIDPNLSLVVFGGQVPKDPTKTLLIEDVVAIQSDVWVYQIAAAVWRRLLLDGEQPSPTIDGTFKPGTAMIRGYTGPLPKPRASMVSTLAANRYFIIQGGLTLTNCPERALRCEIGNFTKDSFVRFAQTLGDTWILDLKTRRWREVCEMASLKAQLSRFAHSATMVGNKLVVAGGSKPENDTDWSAVAGEAVRDKSVWLLDLSWTQGGNVDLSDPVISNLTWRRLHLQGDPLVVDLSALFNPTIIGIDERYAILFGGHLASDILHTSVERVDTMTGEFTQLPTTMAQQSATGRASIAATTVAGVVLLYGGYNRIALLSNAYGFMPNGQDGVWYKMQTQDYPGTRMLSGIARTESVVFIVGGFNGQLAYGDVWAFFLDDMSWLLITPYNPAGAIFSPVVVSLSSQEILMYGGRCIYSELEEIWMLNAISRIWKPLNVTGTKPHGRYGASSAFINTPGSRKLFVYGGMSMYAKEDSKDPFDFAFDVFDDSWMIDIDAPQPQWTELKKLPAPARVATGTHLLPRTSWDPPEHEGYVVIMGGAGSDNGTDALITTDIHNVYQEVWLFDIMRNRWMLMQRNMPDGPRHSAAVARAGDRQLVLHGGRGNAPSDQFNPVASSVLGLFGDAYYVNFDENNRDLPYNATWTKLALDPKLSCLHGALVTNDSNLLLFGGMGENGLVKFDHLPTAPITCPAGYEDHGLLQNGCRPCPKGQYSAVPGLEKCKECPAGTTTLHEASISVTLCNTCQKGQCINGQCDVDPNSFTIKCKCHFGYTGRNCAVNLGGIIAGSIFAMIVATIVAVIMVRRQRRRVSKMKQYTELQEQLLEEKTMELEELERAFAIDARELKLLSRIDKESPGAFGEVWLAEWNDRQVAVKRLRDEVRMLDEKAATEFANEIRFMRTLRHKNIVYFYGAGVDDKTGTPFLVTEYLSCGSLTGLLRDRSFDMPWQRQLQFGLDTARGMAFLHGLRPARLHRDLKSANLLVSDRLVVKVADFGTSTLVAHLRAASVSETEAMLHAKGNLTAGVGTLLWTAPEVHDGGRYSLPADVYSFAIVLWEILTRQQPFEEPDLKSPWHVRDAVLSGRRPVLDGAADDWPKDKAGAVLAVMQRCWDGSPAARPSFEDVVEDLSHLEDTESNA